MEEKSILDKVLSSQRMNALSSFEPESVIKELFKILNEREATIIELRHGLHGAPKVTLEEIGKKYQVTRERVRQVENASIRRIREKFSDSLLKDIEQLIRSLLEEYGYIMSERRLVSALLEEEKESEANAAKVRFILNELLDEKFSPVRESGDLYKSWATEQAPWELFNTSVEELSKFLNEQSEPVSLAELVDEAKRRLEIDEVPEDKHQNIIVNFLDITKKIEENRFNEWGLADWPSIRPKRMNDKIYLVMKRHGKPLHFTEIAKKINDASFDHRIAYPATIHNELILDTKYVLVGRGIYALMEWGYKPGIVIDVIREVLSASSKPMTRDEIIAEVLKNRMVKKSTVALALMNKKVFQKHPNGSYSLAT